MNSKASGEPYQRFHTITVQGRSVQLRVFSPPVGSDEFSKPAVVMVCGLLWFGGGLLGEIGLRFNDAFGFAFARAGMSCVQIHTPQQHMAQTRILDLALLALLPLSIVPGIRFLLLAVDLLLLATSKVDLLLLLPFVALPGLLDTLFFTATPVMTLRNVLGSLLLVTALHASFRAAQWWLGELDLARETLRDYLCEVQAAVDWARKNWRDLGDRRLVLCGYSSGAHVAALYGIAACEEHRGKVEPFEAVLLISGIYDLRTASWTGWKRLLAAIHNLLYGDIIGANSDTLREAASPVAVAHSTRATTLRKDCPWWVLSATKELMGIQPFEHILFDCAGLVNALQAKGATVRRAECGYNHWVLVFSFASFARSFAESFNK
mmetsp:Transcript_28557/g.51717  ORF Transcript_28557/g.51717 Transcript_28557/m.51717 type:complete len:378 (+) Transcript_28557:134-1267(+)